MTASNFAASLKFVLQSEGLDLACSKSGWSCANMKYGIMRRFISVFYQRLKSFIINSHQSSEVFKNIFFAAIKHNNIGAFRSTLFFWRSPTTVLLKVPNIWVFSIKCCTDWTFSHIRKKCAKIVQPLITHSYASPSIRGIFFVSNTRTSGFCVRPGFKRFSAAIVKSVAVFKTSFANLLNPYASTTLGYLEVINLHDFYCAAPADNSPHRSAPAIRDSTYSSQNTKFFPRYFQCSHSNHSPCTTMIIA